MIALMQEKRSAYAPGEEQPVRYDGIYRIARAYRKPGAAGAASLPLPLHPLPTMSPRPGPLKACPMQMHC